MKQVAIVGTQGVPASYGGFETLVENIIGDTALLIYSIRSFAAARIFPMGRSDTKDAG